jgi:hypothetical protein
MDFSHLILAHSQWKRNLRNAIEESKSLDAATAGRDDLCELGKWMAGEGAAYANLPAYQDLKVKHAKFHASVAKVINQAHSLPKEKALELLDPLNSEFGQVSSACINAIGAFQGVAQG